MKKDRSNRIVVSLVVVIVGLLSMLGYIYYNTTSAISSYKECVEAGNTILKTKPAQCVTADGKVFVDTDNLDIEEEKEEEEQSESTTKIVEVYFSKDPSSFDDPSVKVAVERETTRVDVATFGIEQLLAGATEKEQISGLFTPLKLVGESNCSGKDFKIEIEERIATIQFCKVVNNSGTITDAQITEVVTATIDQFSTVDVVIILDRNGSCFADMSGLNKCLEK